MAFSDRLGNFRPTGVRLYPREPDDDDESASDAGERLGKLELDWRSAAFKQTGVSADGDPIGELVLTRQAHSSTPPIQENPVVRGARWITIPSETKKGEAAVRSYVFEAQYENFSLHFQREGIVERAYYKATLVRVTHHELKADGAVNEDRPTFSWPGGGQNSAGGNIVFHVGQTIVVDEGTAQGDTDEED